MHVFVCVCLFLFVRKHYSIHTQLKYQLYFECELCLNGSLLLPILLSNRMLPFHSRKPTKNNTVTITYNYFIISYLSFDIISYWIGNLYYTLLTRNITDPNVDNLVGHYSTHKSDVYATLTKTVPYNRVLWIAISPMFFQNWFPRD